jgi:AcrR family transcriptional regulator
MVFAMSVKVMTKGGQTRQRILDLAEEAVLAKGFAATSIEELIAAAGITKSGFFYHFRDKNDLAKELIARYAEREGALMDDLFAQADALNDDPLHGFLIFLKLLADVADAMPGGHPGCIVASYAYQQQLLNAELRALLREFHVTMRRTFRARLDAIAERYPPRAEVDLDALADMLGAVMDGGIIQTRALGDGALLPRQVMLYRSYVRLLFTGR